jgi:hypothetical protein
MKPPPERRYDHAEWIKAIGIDHQIEAGSAVLQCAAFVTGEHVMVRMTDSTISLCHAGGSFRKRLAAIANVLLIDDLAIAPIGLRERNNLLKLHDDRVGAGACVAS